MESGGVPNMTVRAKAGTTKPGLRAQPRKSAPTDSSRSTGGSTLAPKNAAASGSPSTAGPGEGEKPGRQRIAVSRAQAIRELADRANSGSEQALAHLRRLLDTCPEIWEHAGDLARHTESAWLDLIAGTDHLL